MTYMVALIAMIAMYNGAALTYPVGSEQSLRSIASIRFAREVSARMPMPTNKTNTQPPVIPQDWVAEAEFVEIMNGKSAGNPFGIGSSLYHICQDGSHQRLTQELGTRLVGAPAEWVGTPQEWMNQTTYELASFTGMKINDNKYAFPSGNQSAFHDMFAWVRGAHDGGALTEKGRLLHRWFLDFSSGAENVSMELLVDEKGLPVQFSENVSMSSGPYKDFQIKYVFHTFAPNKTLPELWKGFNMTEYTHPERCPAPLKPDEPVVKTMYIFHPKNQFDIAGQDLGDDQGDTVFVCLDALTNFSSFTDHNYAWLTKWEIEVVPQYGQYQNCNGYNPPSCFGQETFLVGHDAAYYLGPLSAMHRQCGVNAKVGEWYSLPIAGECNSAGAKPGDGSCTWKKRHLKTIDGQCLIHTGGFKNMCIQEQRAPFAKSRSLFLKAFESDDPKSGGCPPLPFLEQALVV